MSENYRNNLYSSNLNLLIFFLTLLSSGCASTYLQIPIQRFSTPEVTGSADLTFNEMSVAFRRDDTLEFSAGLDSARTITAKYLEATGKDSGSISKNAGIDFPVSVGGGLLDRLEYLFSFSAFFTPQELELKYQLVGEPRSKAGSGNFSIALSFLIGGVPLKLNAHLENDTNQVNWSSSQTLLSEGFITGYRFNQSVLVYSGFFLNQSWFSVSRDEANAAGIGQVTSNYSNQATSATVNLGLELMPWASDELTGFFIRGELAASNFSLNEAIKVKSPWLVGLQLGSRF